MNNYQPQQPSQNPYAPQPPHPYAAQQQPAHPYAQQQQPPHPYAAQQQPPYPYPAQQQPPNAYQQQPHLQQQRPAVPEEIGDVRRMLAAGADWIVTIVGGLALAKQLGADMTGWPYLGLIVGCVFGVSFVHHVFATWIFRATLGKFLLVTRVVREDDGGRPRFWRIVWRWLVGLTWVPMQPVRSLIAADGDPYEDHCGLKYVLSRDLR
ncbi:RDD family protein [Streptomyces boluensis]|uniref:RDD domain-containing protein n=1 Tax=Streptomyces boluensis TaxID=1775135 RepID=A0A964UK90_9ACTN|nr:RDD family protein [Streptomyces boluensis]NBE50644.1 hypothetical protein [Streptomyces boluensis]